MENNIFGVGGIRLYERKGFISLQTLKSPSFWIALAIICAPIACVLYMFYDTQPFVESRANICTGECSLDDLRHTKCYEFNSDYTDVFLFEIELEAIEGEALKYQDTVNLAFSLDFSYHNNEKCEDKKIFRHQSSSRTKPFELQRCKNKCDKIFVAQQNYFSGKFVNAIIETTNETNLKSKSFKNIDLIITKRNPNYFRSECYIKGVFCLITAFAAIYFFRRISQYSYSDLGVVQTQIVAIILLCLFFNEPLFFFYRVQGYPIVEIFNSLCQASLISLLMYFTMFLLDSLTIQQIFRESACKFYGIKLLLTFFAWVMIFAASTSIKFREYKNAMATHNEDFSVDEIILWAFAMTVMGYSFYIILISLRSRSNDSIKKNAKLFIYLTLACMIFTLCSILFSKFKVFASRNGPEILLPFNELISRGTVTLYIVFITIAFSPKVISLKLMQEKNKHQEIINQLYERELPEMPTMREDTETYNDRGQYQLPPDEEEEPKQRSTDPIEQKKEKIWEAIQKEVDEDDDADADADSDAEGSDPDIDNEDSEESQESEEEGNEKKDP
ncbi:unnamed protein product [Moneuplotes crassus]|uniref:Wntless-like transmembrane domain-containing protein n=1 Tax=Euplotes crassus TaxID=5936 RepID=A0AAD1U9J3_EUPCR|nr:unnamed protein product [Moneuplotes crassus]